jgi:hypothetical protein
MPKAQRNLKRQLGVCVAWKVEGRAEQCSALRSGRLAQVGAFFINLRGVCVFESEIIEAIARLNVRVCYISDMAPVLAE